MSDELMDKMRALADTGHPRAVELREKATALDEACDAITKASEEHGKVAVKSMLGAWARARRLWCDCTGEPLI